jgi:hypothetical protein
MIKLLGLTSFVMLWATLCSAQLSNDSTAISQAVLVSKNPLFDNFSCSARNTTSIELQWKSENNKEGDYFVVERSSDGLHYETVSVQAITDTSAAYTHLDNPPPSGSDFYRIKYISKTGNFFYSKPIEVSLASDVDFKFYPNPADKLLIIRSGHSIDVEVLDGSGEIKLNKQLPAGLQIINVSSLEKGAYVLKVSDRQTNKVISEPLLKN